MMSKSLTTFDYIGSIIARTSFDSEMWRLLRNSTLRPWYLGLEISLPS
jgi:hypothetical protein